MWVIVSGGAHIYGPFESGFGLYLNNKLSLSGQACTNSKGSCAAGIDVVKCAKSLVSGIQDKITIDCGVSIVKWEMLIDNCGGHADPYHYQTNLLCD